MNAEPFFAYLFLAVLAMIVVLSVLIAGFAALVWANAIAAAYRAHAHRLQLHQAEVTQEAVEEAAEAVRNPRAPYTPPTEAEIRASILAAREDREYTTHGNEGDEMGPPIPPGGLYAEAKS